jgi:hypothetical protein
MKYNYKDVSSKVRAIADKTLTQDDLCKSVIVKRGTEYQAYGEYHIQEMPDHWQVTTDFSDKIRAFSTPKVALAWSIAYKTQRFELASRIEYLDSRLRAKQADVDLRVSRLKQGAVNNEDKLIQQCRLSEDIHSRQSYKKQLSECVKMTKYIKIKGSSHELSRFNKTG